LISISVISIRKILLLFTYIVFFIPSLLKKIETSIKCKHGMPVKQGLEWVGRQDVYHRARALDELIARTAKAIT